MNKNQYQLKKEIIYFRYKIVNFRNVFNYFMAIYV